jgi:hypothetical protein
LGSLRFLPQAGTAAGLQEEMMSAHLVPRIHRIASLGGAIMLALGVHNSNGADDPSGISSMSVDELKSVYLRCEQATTIRRLNGGDVMYCSLVYEQLKEKAFGGEFRRITYWSNRNCLRCSPESQKR